MSEWRDRRIDAGLCVDCGLPAAENRVRCGPCAREHSAVEWLRYHARRNGARRVMRCGLCKTLGQERRGCGVPT